MTDTTDPVRAALAELVALKQMKQQVEDASNFTVGGPAHVRWQALKAEYNRRKPLAWAAAEAALSAPPYDLIQQMRSFLLAHRPDDGGPVDKQFGKMLEALSAPPAEPALLPGSLLDTMHAPDGVVARVVQIDMGGLKPGQKAVVIRAVNGWVPKIGAELVLSAIDSAMKNGEAPPLVKKKSILDEKESNWGSDWVDDGV